MLKQEKPLVVSFQNYFDLDHLSSGVSSTEQPFNSENQIETDQNYETLSEESKAGDELLLVRGTHFCANNNRVTKLK